MKKILVVDDSIYSRVAVSRALKALRDDYEVVPAIGIQHARELLAQTMVQVPEERFIGVLSDLNMEYERAGLDLLKEVSSKYPEVWTLLMSGGFTTQLLNEAATARIHTISKPFTLETLDFAIKVVSSTPS